MGSRRAWTGFGEQGNARVERETMKVGLYLQTDSDGIGGACFWTACLASHLSRRHEVTVLHHKQQLGRGELATFTGQDLSAVQLQRLPAGECAAWHRHGGTDVTALSRGFDVFITMTHLIPPACAAKVGVLIVLFPLEPRNQVWPWSEGGSRLSPRRMLREWRHGQRWKDVFDSYRIRTALSTFCQEWVRQLWQTDSEVLYPPSARVEPSAERDLVVVSIGRFATEGVSKHQLELARMFRDDVAPHAPGWRYACMGTLDPRPEGQRYWRDVLSVAKEAPIDVLDNLPRPRLSERVGRARVFWHAAGLTVDEARQPQLCEHFGHVTVEAMSAGCVPVIIGKGGQKEIVRHGVDGFVCRSLEEMADHTRRLIDDEPLRARMSGQAIERAQTFSVQRSMDRLADLVVKTTGAQL
jgi:glycosyltransferase involved in cell wall biosynthesis